MACTSCAVSGDLNITLTKAAQEPSRRDRHPLRSTPDRSLLTLLPESKSPAAWGEATGSQVGQSEDREAPSVARIAGWRNPREWSAGLAGRYLSTGQQAGRPTGSLGRDDGAAPIVQPDSRTGFASGRQKADRARDAGASMGSRRIHEQGTRPRPGLSEATVEMYMRALCRLR